MNFSVVLNWKSFVALGAAAGIVILSLRMDKETVGQVSAKIADTVKDFAAAKISSR